MSQQCTGDERINEVITLMTSSKVKIARYTHSHTAMNAALDVPSGSSGDSHAIVVQLARMVRRMSGSNTCRLQIVTSDRDAQPPHGEARAAGQEGRRAVAGRTPSTRG